MPLLDAARGRAHGPWLFRHAFGTVAAIANSQGAQLTSGYSDGGNLVHGGFAADGRLVAVHIDFNNAALTPNRYQD